MTTTEETTAATVAESPFRMTRLILQNLGSCGPYVRRFTERFPESEYPDGVEITEEVCATHVDDFDWNWALAQMLNYEGRALHDRLMRSRSAENRRFGTSERRRAAIFGHIFDTRPDLRHEATVDMQTRAEERADEQALGELNRVKRFIADHERQVAVSTREIERLRGTLPEIEARTVGAALRQAKRKAREAAQAIQRLEERVNRAREAAAVQDAEVQRLTALEAEQNAANAVEREEPSAKTNPLEAVLVA